MVTATGTTTVVAATGTTSAVVTATGTTSAVVTVTTGATAGGKESPANRWAVAFHFRYTAVGGPPPTPDPAGGVSGGIGARDAGLLLIR
jgi:hypothetical protein